MKIVTILGARPQFIKAGTVSRQISHHDDLSEVIVHTGQHYDSNMSDIFFDEMKIPIPDYFLGVGGSSHGAMTGQLIEKIENVLIKESPDWVLVYGDTNSTLAGALAAVKLHIKVAHVEAGLRSFNNGMPEEINRILTDRISKALFCPTQVAVANLVNEGVNKWDTNVHLVGDVMQEGAFFYRELCVRPENIKLDRKFVLVTIHRAENTDNNSRLANIIQALNVLAETIQLVLPIHPRTKNKLKNLGVSLSARILVIDPVGYLEMIWLIDNCKIVITDSGGLQKEAFFFGKNCITTRDETEWTELVDNNYNILVGADQDRILDAYFSHVFADDFGLELYGPKNASRLIVETLVANVD
jgi:UDP-GlcNAc3NAcA epimerase